MDNHAERSFTKEKVPERPEASEKERVPMKRLCILAALICLLLSGCAGLLTKSSNPPNAKSTSTTNLAPHWGVQTKTSGCAVSGPLQDPACTPGDIFPTVTKEQVCTSGYASSVRNVPTSVKNKAYIEYGILKRLPGQYEVDHLVNLSIGGSNALANLWPEAINPKPGSREKDRVESYLHDQVCAGKISLQEAQIEIAANWLAVYNRMPSSAKMPATAMASIPTPTNSAHESQDAHQGRPYYGRGLVGKQTNQPRSTCTSSQMILLCANPANRTIFRP